MIKKIATNLYLYEDTCNVYVIKTEEKAVLIDFGDGNVLKYLDTIGVESVTDVFITHHHRDQCQGLPIAVKEKIRIWVPHSEQDLFHHMDEHWQAREINNNYNMRQDRFSILHSVPVYKTLKDYSTHVINGINFTIIPSPGHTIGSITIMTDIDDKKTAFTGDLIYAPGKVWSLAATQWSYNGGEGIALSVLSLLDLIDREPDLLLPSHGQIMEAPSSAMELLIERYALLMKHRMQNPRLFKLRDNPYEEITPHLLQNCTSMSNAYVVLSNSGKALFIDFGYDFIGGIGSGSDRASRRPWLYTLSRLKEQYGVEKIDVVIPTHYHDDHVAGINLLRDVEGTEVWCPENVAEVLENPKKYDLPCLWYDPIKVDKQLPLNQLFKWEEYEFIVYEQAGHTLYAAAIEFSVDGKKVLAIGDQYQGENGQFNYVYQNRFRISDYVDSAELYKSVKPDLIISGHWEPIVVSEEFLLRIDEKGKVLEQLHKDLLPLEELDFGAEGFGASIVPYQTEVESGQTFSVTLEIKNPFPEENNIIAKMITPAGWKISNREFNAKLPHNETVQFTTLITIPEGFTGYRERIAVDLTVGKRRFGQHAEALVTIKDLPILGGAENE